MKLFGRSHPSGNGPAGPLVVALLEGWGITPGGPHPAFNARTPGFNRLAQRAAATLIAPGPAPTSLTCALSAIAQGTPPGLPHAALDGLLRAQGGLAEAPGFQAFVRDLSRVGGDCHILCCLTSSGIEGLTGHAAKIAASLSHQGIRVWVHAVLDGRDTAPDAGLGAMHEFLEDVAGVEQVSFATVSGRTFALDDTTGTTTNATAIATASSTATALVRDAIIDAAPQVAESLGAYVDAENRKGVNDADIKPAAAPSYAGMRSDDALLIIHPQPDGFSTLLDTLLPAGDLSVPAARPTTLSACRRMIGWPQPGDNTGQSRAPIELFQPSRPRLPDMLREAGCDLFMTAPRSQRARAAASLEGCTPAASRIEPATNALDAADRAVNAIKQGGMDVIIVLLGGVPAQARNNQDQLARRTIEQQDKGLGRIAAIMERRGGTLMALGTDFALTPKGAAALPCLISGSAYQTTTPLEAGSLADIAPTILALAGLVPDVHFAGRSITTPSDRLEQVDAAASS